jgi:serine/threonine-protein kinase
MENQHSSQIERQIGKYRLVAELGRGGMANVYLAVAQGPAGFNKLVVIKLLKSDLASDPSFVEMFLNEAQLAARLNHPNAVQTNEVGADGSRPFIAMEFLDGQPLNRILHRGNRAENNPFSLAMHLRVLSEMLAGLHHAHELQDYDGTPLGVVHRDVTPHNIFVTYDGQVKVVDFGIAKVLNSNSHTQTGVLKGKVQYMAPEQVRGEAIDRRADLFTVGTLLWEAAAGKRMWKGLADVTILKRMVLGEIPAITEEAPDADPELIRIINKALSLEPADRYQTALALKADLDAFLKNANLTVSADDLRDWLKSTFAEERAKLQKIIESQIAKVRSMPTSELMAASLPIVDLSATIATSASFTSGGTPSGLHSSPGPSSASSASLAANASAQTLSGGEPRGNGKILGGIAVVAALAVGGFFLTRSTPPTPTTPPEATAAAPREIEVTFTATPPEAQLFWDDKPLPGNPFKGRFPADGKAHRLVVRAPGHLERVQEVDLSIVSEITVRLEREPEKVADKGDPAPKDDPKDDRKSARNTGGGRPVPQAPPPTAAPTPTPTPTPTQPPADSPGLKVDPGKKPKRNIDKDVPYPLSIPLALLLPLR